ncbi:MAG: AtzE family amidohydrolase [Spirulinaceae cyanobacterium SM2_1_0]|nr:AtzE family amidohydrolase [Spirulinaceae cyanobacterium SM2_1_0]
MSFFDDRGSDASAIAASIQRQEVSATRILTAVIAAIDADDADLNCFTTRLTDTARAEAAAIDRAQAENQILGDLAGVPFAVKDLFDISGIPTLAGSKINRENPPATTDATAVARLRQAGAVLVGALNMDEYAYGFTTENHHYGATRNPRDRDRIAGGSSGGSAAAVAAGLVPLALGTDTNGSVRVPAALCGIFGLKPTYGRISRAGVTLFASSFDHVGLFARSVRDTALAFDLLQGADPRDPVCTTRVPEPTRPPLAPDIAGLRIATAAGYFQQGGQPEVFQAVQTVASALGATQTVTIPEAARARAAAYLITASEGSSQHLARLQTRPQDFDPATRDRFLAGALIPAPWYVRAQRFRRWYRDRLRDIFQTCDILLAPTTPWPATLIGQESITIDGNEILIRPNLGRFTQPLSFVGLPIISVPLHRPGHLPLGVQLIAAPYQEAKLLRVAAYLEQQGVVSVAAA